MKSWFADNYEKIILLSAVSLIILQIFISSGEIYIKISNSTQYSQFKIIKVEGGNLYRAIKKYERLTWKLNVL